MASMTHELRGSVQVKETGRAVAGAWVRLVTGKKPLPEVVRTGEEGTFSFTHDWQGDGRIEVADRDGTVLVTWPLKDKGQSEVCVEVSQDVLEGSALRYEVAPAVLRAEVLKALAAAIGQLESSVQPIAAQVLHNLRCALPPIATLPGLVDLSRDVLEGRAGAATRFWEHLTHFEAWNAAHYPARPEPAAIEPKAFLDELGGRKHTPHARGVDRDRIVELEVLVQLIAAAAVTGGDNKTRQWAGVQAVHGQLHALAQLRPLLRDARATSFGAPGAREAFQNGLGRLGGLCMPDFHPFPTPGGGRPTPFPDPGDWHDPIGVPNVNEECPEHAAEIVAGALAADRTRFEISRIEPDDACPGETLTLHGIGLSPAGHVPMVGFSVEGSRSVRFVSASAFSDTHIEVRVPDDAICGELEVNLPVRNSIFACDVELAFHARPTRPIPFHGGRTRIRGLVHRPARCVHSGGEVEIAWQVCNAATLELTIEITERPSSDGSPGHASEEVISLDPTAESHTVRIPDLDRHGSLSVRLVATSRCKRDERSIIVGIQRRPSRGPTFFSRELNYTNWHGNVTRPVVGMAKPTTLDALVDAVRTAESLDLRLGVEGTFWSYTDCIAPRLSTPLVIHSSGLNRILGDVLGEAGLEAVQSVLSDGARGRIDRTVAAAREPETAPPLPIRDRLVHVEAGIKLWDLNCRLDNLLNLAIPNLGGSRGQSLAGAINTGTHGATVELPPIPDLVRAIHLVANGGQQWWIERRSKPVTDEAVMRSLMARGVLDPCLELRYDDSLFDACLVAAGHAGVVYAYVVEAVPLHNLLQQTRRMNWEAVKAEIQRDVIEPTGSLPWYYEVSVNPSPGRPAWVTTRTPTAAEPTAAPDSRLTDALWIALFGTTAAALGPAGLIGLGTGALGFVMGGFGLYFARRSAELARIFTNVFELWRIPEIQQDIDLIEHLTGSVDDIVEAINVAARGDASAAERELAEGLPDLLNALWRIGFYVASGQQILDTVQNLFTNLDQRPPGTRIDNSYAILTGQDDCLPQRHSALERLIHSQEYAISAEQLVPFAEAILNEANAVRSGEDDALIVILNLRFVRQTEAMMGLQQFPLTGLVEVWTVDRIEGNASFHNRVNRLVNAFEALPHWGHVHEVQDLSGRFPRHTQWRRQLDMIARTGGRPNTFRHRFALDRGLLEDL